MGVLSLVIGLITLVGMGIGLIPLLGWLNWFNIPIAIIGLVLGVAALSSGKRGIATSGITVCSIVIVIGAIRLGLGGGII